MNKKIYIFFGPPGSGKGTQTDMVGVKFNLPVISTGELLRHEEKQGTPLGKQIAAMIDKGELVPDAMIHKMIVARLAQPDADAGFILDGYPRDAEQLKDLISMLDSSDKIIPVEIRVSDKEVVNRLSGRRVCDCGATYHLVYNPPKVPGKCNVCGKAIYIRPDDKPEIVRERLAHYKASAEALVKYATEHHNLISIDGERPIQVIQAELLDKLAQIS